MAKDVLDRIYQVSGDSQMRALYDEWAQDYDRDLQESGYLTPARLAEALAQYVPDRSTPILDFACGTGLSGIELAKAGFTQIDGTDLSQAMLDIAATRSIYRTLFRVEPNQPLPKHLSQYPVITAVGAISKGAAPASAYDELLDLMQAGSLLALSLNDLSVADPEYADMIDKSVTSGKCRIRHKAHGPHLSKYGPNSGSTITIVERLA